MRLRKKIFSIVTLGALLNSMFVSAQEPEQFNIHRDRDRNLTGQSVDNADRAMSRLTGNKTATLIVTFDLPGFEVNPDRLTPETRETQIQAGMELFDQVIGPLIKNGTVVKHATKFEVAPSALLRVKRGALMRLKNEPKILQIVGIYDEDHHKPAPRNNTTQDR